MADESGSEFMRHATGQITVLLKPNHLLTQLISMFAGFVPADLGCVSA